MRVFMLGWEFPPFISGGLGTACYGMTRGLDRLGVEVLFVLPQAVEGDSASHVRLLSPNDAAGRELRADRAVSRLGGGGGRYEFRNTRFHSVNAGFRPYDRPAEAGQSASTTVNPVQVAETVGVSQVADGEPTVLSTVVPGTVASSVRVVDLGSSGPGSHYAGDMFAEIEKYARLALIVAEDKEFDVVHAHDWMTFAAGIAVSRASGRPLVVHVHSTEFDRSGLNVHQRIYDIERAGMHAATRVIAVSQFTKNIVVRHYGIDARKVDVVHNAVDEDTLAPAAAMAPITRDDKIVLFLGRITMQKGPEYFLMAAKRVLEVIENVRFVMAGSGDMVRRMIEMAAGLGIGHKVLFTGFLRGDDVTRVFRMADLYVMPSVSEPFGIAPLEAMSHDVPVLISKQSGVSEVIHHALKVDFWDVDEMANKIIAVLRHPPLQQTLRQQGSIEVRQFSWADAAQNCLDVYERAVRATGMVGV